jgi:gliding motility-associated-like protein
MAQTSQILGGLGGPSLSAVATPASCVDGDGSILATASGTALPLTYSLDNGPFGNQYQFTGLKARDYLVQVQDGNGCLARYPVTVGVKNTLVLTMDNDTTICEGTSAKLAATSPNGVSYQWTPSTALSNAHVLQPVASPTTTTTYSLTATWGLCTRSGSQTVTVNPAPVADAGPPDTTCYGKSVSLQGSGLGGNGSYTYQWQPRVFLNSSTVASPTVEGPTATTNYHLTVTDGNGCASLNNAHVTITVLPPPPLFAGNDTNVVAGQPVPLHAVDVAGSGFVHYAWTPAGELVFPDSSLAVLPSATETTTFVVTGTTALGCQGVDSMTVWVFTHADAYVPGAFSPNHDGHNDVLRVVASSIRLLKVFAVYDRWGSQLFTSTNPAVGWDGTFNGREMPAGVYVWVVVGVDYAGKTVERKGTVVLVR